MCHYFLPEGIDEMFMMYVKTLVYLGFAPKFNSNQMLLMITVMNLLAMTFSGSPEIFC
jgi:hypothetical protein